jgi:hypothetical protein
MVSGRLEPPNVVCTVSVLIEDPFENGGYDTVIMAAASASAGAKCGEKAKWGRIGGDHE